MKYTITALLALLACGFFTRTVDAGQKKPNVLFILTDDQRADTIAALGNKHIKTPALDSLVKRGFVFHRAYCMGSVVPAVCLPSRTMILTGRSLFRLPPTKNPGNVALLPLLMRMAGYATLRTGKFGNYPGYAGKAFDQNIVIRRHITDSAEHADNAIRFIKSKRDGKPFFCYVALGAPHDPRVAPKKYMDMYPPGSVPLPPNYRPVHPWNNGEMTIRDERLAPWPRTKETVQKHLADYYADITYMDAQIARIFQALEETGQADNTIIIFTSDHGLAVGSHGLFGKQNLYEDGMRVPLVIAGPGIPKNRSSEAMVYLFDLFPTVSELVGAKTPAELEGKSLAPILHGEKTKVRDSLFFAYRNVQRAAATQDWKVYYYPQVDKHQLFNIEKDPHELKNLADDPKYAGKLKEMTALLRNLQKEFADTQPLVVANPKDWRWSPPKDSPKKKNKKKGKRAKSSN